MKRDDVYKYNGLKSPLWSGLHSPLFSPFEGSSLAGGGQSWSPLSLFAAGEKGVWYDPSDFSTMWQDTAGTTPVTAVGQSVARIDDKSGNGKHATQATPANRPLLQESGGKYYLAFDGTNDFLSTGSIDFTGTDKMTVVSGVRRNSNALSVTFELSATFNSNPGTFVLISGDDGITTNGYTAKGRGSINTTLGGYKSGIGFPVSSVLTSTHDISGDLDVLRVDGSPANSGTQEKGTGNFGNYPLYIGCRGGTSLPFNGHIYQLIVRGAATADPTAVEAYVAGKTGVTL